MLIEIVLQKQFRVVFYFVHDNFTLNNELVVQFCQCHVVSKNKHTMPR